MLQVQSSITSTGFIWWTVQVLLHLVNSPGSASSGEQSRFCFIWWTVQVLLHLLESTFLLFFKSRVWPQYLGPVSSVTQQLYMWAQSRGSSGVQLKRREGGAAPGDAALPLTNKPVVLYKVYQGFKLYREVVLVVRLRSGGWMDHSKHVNRFTELNVVSVWVLDTGLPVSSSSSSFLKSSQPTVFSTPPPQLSCVCGWWGETGWDGGAAGTAPPFFIRAQWSGGLWVWPHRPRLAVDPQCCGTGGGGAG